VLKDKNAIYDVVNQLSSILIGLMTLMEMWKGKSNFYSYMCLERRSIIGYVSTIAVKVVSWLSKLKYVVACLL